MMLVMIEDEGKKNVAVGAVFRKGRLQGLDPKKEIPPPSICGKLPYVP